INLFINDSSLKDSPNPKIIAYTFTRGKRTAIGVLRSTYYQLLSRLVEKCRIAKNAGVEFHRNNRRGTEFSTVEDSLLRSIRMTGY
ncbi:MAG: hypothetical protein N3B12_02280, partial [Armatimonadetes bacterium]|nr:hypothetical protein [Armatimonadota bacterium]